jgi:hypothetical protein
MMLLLLGDDHLLSCSMRWRTATSEIFQKHLKLRRFERIYKQCGYFEKFAACLKTAVILSSTRRTRVLKETPDLVQYGQEGHAALLVGGSLQVGQMYEAD